MASTDITTTPADDDEPKGKYLVLNHSSEEITEIIQDNLAGQQIGEFDLPRIKMPAGGGKTWEIPGLSGIESTQELEGIVVGFKRTRAYWEPNAEEGSPPTCRSADTIIGVGNPGGDCRSCPLAQYGTAINDKGEPGRGQACNEKEIWFILRPGSFLPVVVSLPSMSLKPAKSYRLALAGEGKRVSSVTTILTLDSTKNPDGKPFSYAVPRLGTVLDGEEAERAKAYARQMQPSFESAAAAETAED